MTVGLIVAQVVMMNKSMNNFENLSDEDKATYYRLVASGMYKDVFEFGFIVGQIEASEKERAVLKEQLDKLKT